MISPSSVHSNINIKCQKIIMWLFDNSLSLRALVRQRDPQRARLFVGCQEMLSTSSDGKVVGSIATLTYKSLFISNLLLKILVFEIFHQDQKNIWLPFWKDHYSFLLQERRRESRKGSRESPLLSSLSSTIRKSSTVSNCWLFDWWIWIAAFIIVRCPKSD